MTSGASFSLAPTQLNFIGGTDEVICEKVILKTDNLEHFEGKTSWAKKNYFERILRNHKLKAENLGLEIEFEKNITALEEKEIEICIKGKKTGNYHGALLYKIKDKPMQMGIWMDVNLSKDNYFSKITGDTINSKNSQSYNIFFIISGFLLLVFLFLIFLVKSKKNEFNS